MVVKSTEHNGHILTQQENTHKKKRVRKGYLLPSVCRTIMTKCNLLTRITGQNRSRCVSVSSGVRGRGIEVYRQHIPDAYSVCESTFGSVNTDL